MGDDMCEIISTKSILLQKANLISGETERLNIQLTDSLSGWDIEEYFWFIYLRAQCTNI